MFEISFLFRHILNGESLVYVFFNLLLHFFFFRNKAYSIKLLLNGFTIKSFRDQLISFIVYCSFCNRVFIFLHPIISMLYIFLSHFSIYYWLNPTRLLFLTRNSPTMANFVACFS